jgi:hypothetical protein
MKELKSYIKESLLLEAAPKFDKSLDGIKAFCEYVYDPEFVNWVVNSDMTITITPVNPAPNGVYNLYMDAKDLTEIPDFITYSNVESITLGLTGSKKLKSWAPKVNGVCKGVIVGETTKLQELDLTNCDCKGGKLFIEKVGTLQKVVGGKGDGVQVFIKKNKSLTHLDLSNFVNCKNPGSYITKNKNLELDQKLIPAEIDCRD